MDWSRVDYLWINVMFLSAVWTLILTAPIHCRGSMVSNWCTIMLNFSKTVKIEAVFTQHHFQLKMIHFMHLCCFGTFKVQVFYCRIRVNLYIYIYIYVYMYVYVYMHNTAFLVFFPRIRVNGVFDNVVFCMQNTSKAQRKNFSVFTTLLLCKRTWRNKLIYILGGLGSKFSAHFHYEVNCSLKRSVQVLLGPL